MDSLLYPGAIVAYDGRNLNRARGTDDYNRCENLFDPQGDRVMMIVGTPYVPEDIPDAEMTTS